MGNNLLREPQVHTNNANDELGAIKVMTDACVSTTTGGINKAQYLIPNNGEYTLAGTSGSCAVCSTCSPRQMEKSDGSCDKSGHCGWAGQYPQYKRVFYNADKDACCLNMKDTEGNLTCNPKYRTGPKSTYCDKFYTNYCADMNNIFGTKCQSFCERRPDLCNYSQACTVTGLGGNNDIAGSGTCNTWCSANPTICNPKIREFCTKNNGQNLNTNFCKDSLIQIGGVDNQIITWCSTHPSDPFCSCIYPKIAYTGDDPSLRALANPRCFDQTCMVSGYPTTTQRETCPTTLKVCGNVINMADATAATIEKANQNCMIDQPKPVVSVTQTPVEQPIDSNLSLFEIFFILIVFLAMVGAFLKYTLAPVPTLVMPVSDQ